MGRSLSLTLLLLVIAVLTPACVKKVTIPEALPVTPPVSAEELTGRINSYGDVQTFAAQTTFLFRNYFTGRGDKAEDFPEADGLLRLKRPENIRMQIKAPVVGTKIADMVSTGREFRIGVYWPDDKRRFIRGTNLSEIEQLDAQDIQKTNDARLKQAGGFVNMRPQHITDAFLIRPATSNGQTDVFREEVRQVEPDPRPGRKGRMVEKLYYVLYIVERGDGGRSTLRRKFWFDRTVQGTPLVRQQTFENNDGRLSSDISYMDWFIISDGSRSWPRHLIIERRNDGYRIELTLERDSVEINAALPEGVFELANTENMELLDLDTIRKKSPGGAK